METIQIESPLTIFESSINHIATLPQPVMIFTAMLTYINWPIMSELRMKDYSIQLLQPEKVSGSNVNV